MFHSFDPAVAARYGILEAVLLRHIAFWIEKNRKNGVNFHNGTYWTYASVQTLAGLLPYATAKQIRRALGNLREQGVLQTGCFNQTNYDRTLWYTLTPYGESICRMGKIETTSETIQNAPQGEPIPDRSTDKSTDKSEAEKPPFHPPTAEDVKAYCKERKNNVDAERFVDYYDSVGWRVGKNPMRDWRAAVRRWERTERSVQPPKKKFVNPDDVCLDSVF